VPNIRSKSISPEATADYVLLLTYSSRPATHIHPGGFGNDSEHYYDSLSGDDQSVHSGSIVASADANANTLNTGDGDGDESGANDRSGTSSDGIDPDTEALEKEMGRYVPRTKPSKPAIGAKPSNVPSAQSKAANNVSQPSRIKSGRPPAVTATADTTAPRPKK